MFHFKDTPVRFSHLRAYGRSGAHGLHARLPGEDEQTYAMERGTAVHAILFGNKPVIGWPGKQRRGKEYEEFAAAHADHEILTMAEFSKARRMADAVRQCALAAPWLKGIYEETLPFRWMNLDCRATPDVRGGDFLTELKTSASSDPAKFVWHARRMAYHAQMRFQQYAGGFRTQDSACMIIAVESEEPHPVTVYRLEPEALEEGDKLLMLWAERLKACESANHFPSYCESIVPIVWPKETEFEWEEETA